MIETEQEFLTELKKDLDKEIKIVEKSKKLDITDFYVKLNLCKKELNEIEKIVKPEEIKYFDKVKHRLDMIEELSYEIQLPKIIEGIKLVSLSKRDVSKIDKPNYTDFVKENGIFYKKQ